MTLAFAKLEAAGNGYLAVDGRGLERDWAALARAMGRDHFGVGSDGLLVVVESERAPLRMRVFNSDGSEAELSGNGLRLFAKFVLDRELARTQDGALQIETGAGLRTVWPRVAHGRVVGARIAMGVPEPTHAGTQTVLSLPQRELALTTLSLGNPHAVHVTRSVEAFPLDEVGPQVVEHPRFPERVNFEILELVDRTTVRARVFERGEGETLSSGTGSTACAVAARWAGATQEAVRVQLRGGSLAVHYAGRSPGDRREAFLDGPTKELFSGHWPEPLRGS